MDDDLLQQQTQNPRTDEGIHVNLENEKVPTGEKQDELRDEKTKKISPAWEYFVKLEGCPVGKEKAKCRLCNVVIGCFSRNGTSAMMNHLKTGQGNSTSKIQTNQSDDSWNDDFEKYMDDRDQGGTGKTELDVYLVDARERKGEVFDILEWWKMNSTRFPILSKIARHVLGMPVSSVASEAAFSTSGRTIDAYRSSLSPKTVEALICSQDWLRTSEIITDLRGEPEDYLQLEKLENDELKVTGNTFQYLDIDD
ncbi:uncharacterized protein LOC108199480 isoform X1 [Daucus carota subsp. sativus]|uniref:uncharacterized protein LOC108199480 isoform X1 n=1 Tax=Daucus carota subsp. sativus TaxID=79200 RepID=UPI0007F022A4|nr:PREDICTED: uncharacterized protein LOC108199480 [Daucus carota subsp. sativus]XP_017222793.1 PREDICTED: uncharacterized protein LOC108199480 [Daucus carota subsp. sativus]XP_017222794.1 PREDICTED: uncharacterized protein LOC108199480 [Daucus carota subsp. sativus]